ncbi:glycosyltransferase family 2 protein [Arenibaculum sp.]|uniref:glycosyltransferase family 2 protein n=1 Tax=Arenibaculum sp. TaxID=2865862 RepID=UPI002E11A0C0|nr:glycosyltransferase [Arenibaculum sp.]
MISVVMPSYNSAPFVTEAIQSVLDQTFPYFELLVCDDGSQDGTQDIVAAFARRDGRVRLLQHSFRSVSLNCNAAVEQARFPWIARLDADDLMVPERLEWQIRAAGRAPEVVLWGGYAHLINRRGKVLRTARSGPTTQAEYQRLRRTGEMIVVQGPSVTFRRDLFLALGGYDRRFDSAEDLEFLSRIAEHGPVRVLPRAVTHYRIHGASITAGRAARQHRLFRYIEARNHARLDGRREESLEVFLVRLDAAPPTDWVVDHVREMSLQHYRNASVHAAEGRIAHAALAAGLAVLLGPRISLGRIAGRVSRAILRRCRDIAARLRGLAGEAPTLKIGE